MASIAPDGLLAAIAQGNVSMLQDYISKGHWADSLDDKGNTLLHRAVAANQPDCVDILLDNHAIVDKKNNQGRTPLHLTAKAPGASGQRIVESLIKSKANINAVDCRSCTPLMIASECGNESVVRTLLDKNADLRARDLYENTAILKAALKEHRGVVEMLLQGGASIDDRNRSGFSALVLHASKGNTGMVDWLLDNNARVDEAAEDGITALIAATLNRHTTTVRTLLARGANVDTENRAGRTAFAIAYADELDDIVELIRQQRAKNGN
ncbi:MAG: hypothetical protein LQ342_004938 [Letrouitia transgressa]|nr:MAG: hypothetical protein LQ342_004938 [Letrouitia transgressa]